MMKISYSKYMHPFSTQDSNQNKTVNAASDVEEQARFSMLKHFFLSNLTLITIVSIPKETDSK